METMIKLECARLGCDKTKDMPDLPDGLKQVFGASQMWFCKKHGKEMIRVPCDNGCSHTCCIHQMPELYDKNGKMIPSKLRKLQLEHSKKLKEKFR